MHSILQGPVAMDVKAVPADEEEAPELGFFFTTHGGVRFSDGRAQAPGSMQAVAVAEKYGIAIYSDLCGELVLLLHPGCRQFGNSWALLWNWPCRPGPFSCPFAWLAHTQTFTLPERVICLRMRTRRRQSE